MAKRTMQIDEGPLKELDTLYIQGCEKIPGTADVAEAQIAMLSEIEPSLLHEDWSV